MKKIFIIAALATIFLLSGCGSVSNEEIVKAIEEYTLDVVGTYKYGGKKEYIFEQEFRSQPKDIEIVKKEKDIVEVSAGIENKYYKLKNRQNIVYQYIIEDGSVKITDAEFKKGDMTVKPVLETYSLEDLLYKSDIKLKFWDETIPGPTYMRSDGAWVEIETTRENILKMEYDIDCTISKREYYGNKSDFGYHGEVIFTLKDGNKYAGVVWIYYTPIEHEDWDGDPEYTILPSESGMNITIDKLKE